MAIKKTLLSLVVLAFAFAMVGPAQAVGPERTQEWMAAQEGVEPGFAPGDTITFENADVLRPFVPPSYQDIMIFDGMEVKIGETRDLSPSDVYKQATLQHQAQVVLAEDGALENFVAGRPFDTSKFVPESTQGENMDGYRAIWNFNFRWQGQGLSLKRFYGTWIRAGGEHDVTGQIEKGYEDMLLGGGTVPRILWGYYSRAYFNFRSDLPDQGYRMQGGWADGTEYRELTSFDEPFDIRGTAFLIMRSTDPRKTDNSWAYIPNLRRVRRISVEVKSDSLLGTDHTIEDFYGFAGRVLEHEWRFVGRTKILWIPTSVNPYAKFYGPNGWAQRDVWQLRDMLVIEQLPSFQPEHPYERKYIFIDENLGDCGFAESYDRGDELWKVWQLSKIWTEDENFYAQHIGTPSQDHRGMRVAAFQSINVIDLQNDRGTLFPCQGHNHAPQKLSKLKKILDVNYLSEGR
jgi:hypothetical protein